MEYRKTISSDMTFIYKYIFSILSIGILSVFTVYFLASDLERGVLLLLFLLADIIFSFRYNVPLKHIELVGNNLIISNYLKSISVPVSEIEKVSENVFVNIHPVWIILKHKTIFGTKIIFMPRSRLNLFGSHPIVKELRELARALIFPANEVDKSND